MEGFDRQEFDPARQYLRVALPPDLSRTRDVRRFAERLADAASLSPSRTYDLKLVLSEAVANAIEHAAVPGEVEIVAWLLPDRLVVEVTNPGSFEPGLSKDTGERRRGLGLPLMVSLADQVHVSRLAGQKTRISLTFLREPADDPGADRASGVRGNGDEGPGSDGSGVPTEGPTTALVQLEAERLKVEAALAEADRQSATAQMRHLRFHALADFTHDWELWLAPDRSIAYSSPSCERITGYTAAELTADPTLLSRIVHPDDRERVRTGYRADHADTGSFECRIITKAGDIRWVGLSSQPITDEEGTYLGVRISSRDITTHMQTLEALRETDERLRIALNNARITIYAVDRQQRYLWVENPSPIFDGTPLVGRTTPEVFQVPEVAQLVEARRQVIETGVCLRTELTLPVGEQKRTFEYSIQPVRDKAGEVTGALVATVDITERRQAEEEIRELSQRLAFHVDHSPLAVIEWGPDMRIIRWSGEARRMFGWSADEVLGKRMEEFRWIYDQDAELVAEVSEELQEGTNPRRFSLNRNYRKDGTVIWCEWYNSSLLDESGRLRSILSLVLDVTERTQGEAALRESEERVRMALAAAEMGAWEYRLDPGDVFWDERARDQWGIPHGDRIDYSGAVERIHVEDRERVVGAVDRAVAGVDGGAYAQDFRVVWDDGLVHWIASYGQVQFEGTGRDRRAIRFIGVNRDITTDRVAQEHRESLVQRQQELAEDLAAANEELRLQNEQLLATERELREANHFALALSRVNESLNSSLDRDEFLRRVVAQSSDALASPQSVLELREPGGWLASEVFGLPEHLRGLHLTDEQASVATAMALTGDVLAIENATHDPRVSTSTMLRYGSTAVLAVPLVVRAQVIGSLQFIWTDGPRRFNTAEVDFARKLTTSIALSLENARLYDEQRTIAHTLQQALLSVPDSLPGLLFGPLHRSATERAEVGGDFYDLFTLPRGRVGIVLGDVSGRGIAATGVAALVKNTIKAYAHRRSSPARVLTDTNHLLLESLTDELFVTAFFGTLEVETGVLRYSSAGHPPALLKTAVREVRSLEHRGPVLGLSPEALYTNAQVDLRTGEVLVLYTDGLTEARRSGELLGERRLRDWLRAADGTAVTEFPEGLLQLALDFTGGQLVDDLAIVSLQRMGADTARDAPARPRRRQADQSASANR